MVPIKCPLENIFKIDKRLKCLWDRLGCEVFIEQTGPYPVTHGKDHVEKVLKNSCILAEPVIGSKISLLTRLYAAAMIHDIGMILMVPHGSKGMDSEKARKNHSKYSRIKDLAERHLIECRFNREDCEYIINIAYAHSGDEDKTAEDKLEEIKKNNPELAVPIIILRLADFLDLGSHRLIHSACKQAWDRNQDLHLKKHIYLEGRIKVNERRVEIHSVSLTGVPGKYSAFVEKEESKFLIKQLAFLRSEYKEANKIVSLLNEINQTWKIEPLDLTLYGEIWPLSSGIKLFSEVFQDAIEHWRKSNDKDSPLDIDMMGHSLYARFVEDAEHINEGIRRYLKQGRICLRVLLLDPNTETQQMKEVYEAQQMSDPDPMRRILPLYESNRKVKEDNLGDIFSSLSKLEDWKDDVLHQSSLIVKVTSRLMYMQIIRFGNRMIVTPYVNKGLFQGSPAMTFSDKSPIYKAYLKEFESIWDSRNETRMMVHNYHLTGNPISNIIQDDGEGYQENPIMSYDKFILKSICDRLFFLFESVANNKNYNIPPFEIEVQPSSQCSLYCNYCIGDHLGRRSTLRNGDFY